jgi:hypothetical protein
VAPVVGVGEPTDELETSEGVPNLVRPDVIAQPC